MPAKCSNCFSCKTRVFRNVDEFNAWVADKALQVSNSKHVEIDRLIRNRGEVRIYWCSHRQKGPYLRISDIPSKNCKKVTKDGE